MTRSPTKLITASLILASAGAFSSAVFAADVNTKAEKELTQIEHAMCAATLKNDVAASAKFSVDDFLEVDGRGDLRTKEMGLDFTKKVKATGCENSDMKVRIYDNTGVVIGKTTFKSDLYNGELKYTDVFVKKNGAWLMVSSHWSEIKPSKL